MRRGWTGGLIAVLAVAAACALAPARVRPGSRADADDLREAVFRHLFDHNASAAQRSAAAYYLSVEGRDPGADFLARFAGHVPPVLPASRSTASKTEGVRDRVTGKAGLRFSVGRITWEGPDRARVEASYYEAGLSSADYTYRMERRDGRWVVGSRVMTRIS